jgi:stalled ribosome rescue protein Dom34
MQFDARGLKQNRGGTLAVRISSDDDYRLLSKLISKGDVLELRIRQREIGKGRTSAGKRNTTYVNAQVTVDAIQVAEDGLEISGQYESLADGRRGRAREWLTNGQEFKLTKQCWTREQLELLRGNSPPRGPAESGSPATGQSLDRAVAEFRDSVNVASDLLCFGEADVLYALDVGAVKTLIVTEATLFRQTEERRAQLKSAGGTFRGAEIVVVPRRSTYSAEVASYGGIVAILKYAFDPSSCR